MGDVEDIVLLGAPGALPIFQCYFRGTIVGIVWEANGTWFADPDRIHSQALRADDQFAAAIRLVETLPVAI